MSTRNDGLRAYYDAVPYDSFSYPQSAPESIAAVAYVFGLAPPATATARVLELGCSSGGNLVPFAARNPHATAVGIDISGAHIERGASWVARLGLSNVVLEQGDLTDVDVDRLGTFDYIVCHGLYSWIPADVQQALLSLCRRLLSPSGVAYLSYNTYPGWKSREVIRDAMLLHAASAEDSGERLARARAMVGFLKNTVARGSVLEHIVNENASILSRTSDGYLAHDYLEPNNRPCYFRDFVAAIETHGLGYLAEAEPSRMNPSKYGTTVASALVKTFEHDPIQLEQYVDFAVDRSFRESLVVHAAQAAHRANRPRRDRFRNLHFAAQLPPLSGPTRDDGSQQEYGVPNAPTLSTSHDAVKATADILTACWPGTVSWADLTDRVARAVPALRRPSDEVLARAVEETLDYAISRGIVRLRLEPVELAASAGERPTVDPHVRAGITALLPNERFVFNAWHETLELSEGEKALYATLDGHRGGDTLVGPAAGAAAPGTASDLRRMLDEAARKGVLVAP